MKSAYFGTAKSLLVIPPMSMKINTDNMDYSPQFDEKL